MHYANSINQVLYLYDDIEEGPAEEHAHEPAQTRRQLPDIIGEEFSLNNHDISI